MSLTIEMKINVHLPERQAAVAMGTYAFKERITLVKDNFLTAWSISAILLLNLYHLYNSFQFTTLYEEIFLTSYAREPTGWLKKTNPLAC